MARGGAAAAKALVWLAICAVPGCSDWRDARTARVSDHVVAIKTQPQPPRVGQAADIAVKITDRDGQPTTGCRVNMRQTMPGMQMKGDRAEIVMEGQGGGVYRGVSRRFGMGGDWRITVHLRCGGEELGRAGFDYHLEWPE